LKDRSERLFGTLGFKDIAFVLPILNASKTILNANFTTRGFTGHEHADGLGIIHMNGRIYDPKLGRMLQADPFIQSPTNIQSLNHYSYVLNNPLSYTDPSGYFSFTHRVGRGSFGTSSAPMLLHLSHGARR